MRIKMRLILIFFALVIFLSTVTAIIQIREASIGSENVFEENTIPEIKVKLFNSSTTSVTSTITLRVVEAKNHSFAIDQFTGFTGVLQPGVEFIPPIITDNSVSGLTKGTYLIIVDLSEGLAPNLTLRDTRSIFFTVTPRRQAVPIDDVPVQLVPLVSFVVLGLLLAGKKN